MRGALILMLALAAAPLAAAQTAPAAPRTMATTPGTPAAAPAAAPATPAAKPAAPAPAGGKTETPQSSAGEAVAISVDTSQGFARINFLWPKPVTFEASLADGVLVLKFARPLKISGASLPLDNYVSVIRQDQDGKTLRMQLKQKLTLHTSAGGPLVAIDLIPSSYKGTPDDVGDPTVKPVAKGPVDVKLKIAAQEDRTQLILDWGEKVDYEAKLAPGKAVFAFHRGGSVDVTRLNKNPPAWVKSAKATGGDNQLLLELSTDPDSTVEHAVDGNTVVIDVKAPKNDKDAQPDDPKVVIPPEIAAEGGSGDKPKDPPPPPADPGATPPLRPGSDGAAVAAAEAGSEPAPDDKVKVGEHAESAPAAPAEGEPAKPTVAPPFKMAREKDHIGLTLPVLADQGAAMFRRGDRLTILFEGSAPIDAASILSANRDLLGSAEAKVVDGVTVMTFTTLKPVAITALQRDGGWVAAISPDPLEPPQAIALLRDARTVGPARVRASLDGARRTMTLTDPDSGETLMVVLAAGQPQGVIGARTYVEFAADPTAQGLVIRPFTDDLTVTPGAHDVIIGSPEGLTLAAGTVAEPAAASAVHASDKPAAMDFAEWQGKKDFLAERSRLLNAIKPDSEGGSGVEPGRIALARFYVANELGQEAIGELELIAMDDEKAADDPSYRALRAAALLVAGRPKEAADDLATNTLDDDPNAHLLRGLAAAGQHKWSQARDEIVSGEGAIGEFRTDWQAHLRVAGAEAALNTNALDVADRMLNAMPRDGVPHADELAAQLIRGGLAERLKQNDEALRLYAEVEKGAYRPLAVRAAFAALSLKVAMGTVKPDEAIKALDELRWQWRGDDVELGILHKLGSLQIAQGQYRDGLQTMRAAVLGFPEAEEMHRIAAEMNVVFEDLFLHGKADALPPVQALGLYYDFKELTPIGAMGDDMVRKLADRLIAVDLLEQAAELLQHQVDNRLDGIAKAQISAKLAAVYLMDRKPEKALATLRASTQTRLPDDLAAQRRLLSGRALMELKETDAALEAFEQDDTPEARRLRADVLWSGSRWPETATALEVLLDGREKEPRPLDAMDRYDILRAAVAYTMADNEAGLASLRQRFVTLIAAAPEAAAFDLVTRKVDPSAVAFRDLAKTVAGTDTLDAFLQSLGLGKPAPGTASR